MLDAAYLEALRALAQPVWAVNFPRSLEPMRALLAALDHPETHFPAVVVAGSVGKGTTCWRLARALQPHPPAPSPLHGEGEKDVGKTRAVNGEGEKRGNETPLHTVARGWGEVRVGLYTGPHLHSFRERFVINGAMISHVEFIEGAKAVTDTAARLAYPYSTFELTTALALWWFAREQVTAAVLEVGMGGRWDAVNAVPNVLAVMTPIEKEHLAMLGGSLQTIAWHKAGIMQPGGVAVTVGQYEAVEDILRSEAERLRVHLEIARHLDWSPEAEPVNAALTRLACWNLQARGLITAYQAETMPPMLPGRLERVRVGDKDVLIDGAHTRQSAGRLRDRIRRVAGERDAVRVIVGMLGDKAIHDVLAVFDEPRFHIVLTQAPSHRALPADALQAQAQLQDAAVEIVPVLADALAQVYTAPESFVVVTGSLRMAAAAREAFGLLSAVELEEAQATRAIFEGGDYLRKLSP